MRRPLPLILVAGLVMWAISCAKLETSNTFRGDKDNPIHIVVDVNIRVDRQLDNFFAFQEPSTAPATAPGN